LPLEVAAEAGDLVAQLGDVLDDGSGCVGVCVGQDVQTGSEVCP